MATVIEQLLLKVGLDATGLRSGLGTVQGTMRGASGSADALARRTQAAGLAAQQAGVAYQQFGTRVGGMLTGLVRRFAGPLAGMAAVGGIIHSYTGSVAEVARMTGAYFPQLEEWRKKRAALARTTGEDIDLYKKSREAVTKFQIAMGDLSATLARAVAPAFRRLIDMLNAVSNWVDRNHGNIVRFLTVLGTIVGVVLVRHFQKLAAAMLANPLTWLIAGIVALAVAVDDLVTYMQGGESLLGDFWEPFASGLRAVYRWYRQLTPEQQGLIKQVLTFGGALAACYVVLGKLTGAMALAAAGGKALAVFGVIAKLCAGLGAAVLTVGKIFGSAIPVAIGLVKGLALAFKALTLAIVSNPIGLAIAAVVAALAALWYYWDDVCAFCKKSWQAVSAAVKTAWAKMQANWAAVCGRLRSLWGGLCGGITGAWRAVVAALTGAFTAYVNAWRGIGRAIIGVFAGVRDWIYDKFSALGDWFRQIFSLDGIFDSVKAGWDKLKGYVGMGDDKDGKQHQNAGVPQPVQTAADSAAAARQAGGYRQAAARAARMLNQTNHNENHFNFYMQDPEQVGTLADLLAKTETERNAELAVANAQAAVNG